MKHRRFISIQYKMIIFSFSLILIVLLIFGSIVYEKSRSIVRDKVSLSNLNTVSQIGSNIDIIMQDIHDISLFLIQSEDVRRYLKLKKNGNIDELYSLQSNIQDALLNLTSSKMYIDNIYIQGFNGMNFSLQRFRSSVSDERVAQIVKLKGKDYWSFNQVQSNNGTIKNYIAMERAINDIDNVSHSLGVLKIEVGENILSSIFRERLSNSQGQYYLLDRSNKIISALDTSKIGVQIDSELITNYSFKDQRGSFTVSVGDTRYLATYYRLPREGWLLIGLEPLHIMLQENNVIFNVILTAAIVSVIICVFAISIFSVRLLGPLGKMRLMMKKIEIEDFNVQLPVKGNDEIALLGQSFNKMSARLRELIHEVYTFQLRQKEAELKSLQAQINPHFLYNTMDMIYWMARMEKAFETSRLVEATSKLFRLSLNSGQEITSVRNEVEHIRNYIVIQQKRYEDAIEFSLDVDDSLLHFMTIKLILQPLVENAIYHGIEKAGGKGTVRIRVYGDGDDLIYQVQDDGAGMDPEEINRLLISPEKENRGFGIKNVNDRIQLYFGDSYGLSFAWSPETGTVVTAKQPKKENISK